MNALEQAIYKRLAAGTALAAIVGTKIYNGLIPRDVALPAVVFFQSSGLEENETPTRSSRFVYVVKGVADSLYQAGQIADAIDDLMHGAPLAVTGYTCFVSERDATVRYIEQDPAGHIIGHAGAEYVIRLEEV